MRLSVFFPLLGALLAATCCTAGGVERESARPRGIPLSRVYTFEDILGASRGAHFAFDAIGRLAVVGSGSYSVLNDSTWLERLGPELPSSPVLDIQDDALGQTYFGALADWGRLEPDGRGNLIPVSLRPAQFPDWVESTAFVQILMQEHAVHFSGLNGIVGLDLRTGSHQFYPSTGNTVIFAVGGRVFASSKLNGIHAVDSSRGVLVRMNGPAFEGVELDAVAPLDDTRSLVSTVDRRLLVFDGTTLSDWEGPLRGLLPGRVPTMERLPGGDIAIGVTGVGLFILSSTGSMKLALTSAEYHRIHDLAAREPGVLWIATETAVQKLLYGGPVSAVDQRLGLPVSWPHVVAWGGRMIVATGGLVYEPASSRDGVAIGFAPMPGQPEHGGSAIASYGTHLLVGNRSGVFRHDGAGFVQVMSGIDVTQLVMTPSGVCYVIGEQQLAVMRLVDGRWTEIAERLASEGFPAVVHGAGESAWIEYGINHATRVWLENGRLKARTFAARAPSSRWTNVGHVGDIVVLNSGPDNVLYFDERTGSLCESPQLDALLRSAPHPIMRLVSTPSGWIWATHERGVFLARPDPTQPSGYSFDVTTSADLREFQPRVQLLGPQLAAVTTASSLYLVEHPGTQTVPSAQAPRLAAIIDRRSGKQIEVDDRQPEAVHLSLPYSGNSLLFRFFSGSYTSLRPPEYEYRLTGGTSDWTSRGTDSHLDLRDLAEGNYRLTVHLIGGPQPSTAPLTVDFVIHAPWFRSLPALFGYALAAIAALWTLVSWVSQRSRRRNAYLEDLVSERTADLRAVMSQLAEESRTTAILTERNRLAGEIHDSVQQGLSGLLLQLGAVLRLPELLPDARSKLEVARRMVSFTRHEVQQAVWNLESPLLEGAELPEALRRMCELIGTGPQTIRVDEVDPCPSLPPSIKHQLLRIAQEAITNAVRHADTPTIVITLRADAARLVMEVRDEGCGFDQDRTLAASVGHFGLRGMRARAAKINAAFELHSRRGQGTRIQIALPLHDIDPAVHADSPGHPPLEHTHPDR